LEFLSSKVAGWSCPVNKHVVSTSGSNAIVKGSRRSMEMWNHEEAGTQLIVHLLDAIINGCHRFIIQAIGTDVVVIIVAKFII